MAQVELPANANSRVSDLQDGKTFLHAQKPFLFQSVKGSGISKWQKDGCSKLESAYADKGERRDWIALSSPSIRGPIPDFRCGLAWVQGEDMHCALVR